jgi:mannobiose 2-epimerase
MRTIRFVSNIALILIIAQACNTGTRDSGNSGTTNAFTQLANELEESLFKYIIDPWYPRNIDTIHGGYISAFNHDWALSEGSQDKAIVQQARHVWATSRIYEAYPEKQEFLKYADHGFRFLRDAMWDKQYGGFYAYVTRNGAPQDNSIDDKRIYGQAFAVYGMSQYYRMSKNEEALNLAKKEFVWMEEHAHDHQYGGYFEMLRRDGTPTHLEQTDDAGTDSSPFSGIKDYNSSIHIMEAITELYLIWPDSLVRARLEEMFLLIRDTFVHPDGYLQLFFRPDWTLVSDEAFNPHITYGHDVETAFLLLETAHVLGWGEDEKTHQIAKLLVDHSLVSGWDQEAGGFFDAGKEIDGEIKIIHNHKSWWGLVEGMNALLLMHTIYPDDPNDYYGKFLKAWEHIDTYLIDKEFGGWYNHALDTYPESVTRDKSHIWKTTYHNARGMINCIHMLRSNRTDAESF